MLIEVFFADKVIRLALFLAGILGTGSVGTCLGEDYGKSMKNGLDQGAFVDAWRG